MTPSGDGTSKHLLSVDLQSNLRNDIRGEAVVDSETLAPLDLLSFGRGSRRSAAASTRRRRSPLERALPLWRGRDPVLQADTECHDRFPMAVIFFWDMVLLAVF